MRASWVVAGAIVGAATASGCTSILGDFTVALDGGAADASPHSVADAGLVADGGEDATLDAGAPEAAPSEDASSSLSIAPTSFDFQTYSIGQSSAAEPFVVTNAGAGSSGSLSVQLTTSAGTDAAEFSVTDGCSGTSLAPGASCSLSVVMSPSSAGAKGASLTVTAPGSGSATATLIGNGTGTPTLSLSPGSFVFPTSAAGSPGGKTDFVLSNTGTATSAGITTALTVGSGTATGEFAVVGDGCNGQTLNGGASCKVTIQFDPATYGSKSASLAVNSGSTHQTATLSGTGEDSLGLLVSKSGGGTGTVTDSTNAIVCGTVCSASFVRTTADPIVTLTVTPSPTSFFTGWGGACSGTQPTCKVTLDSPGVSISAGFGCTLCGTACTNTQTDPNNCGSCGRSCLGGGCSSGACSAYDYYALPSDSATGGIAADSTYVYWGQTASAGYGDVRVCSITPGNCSAPTEFIASAPTSTSGLPGGGPIAEGGGYLAAVGEELSDGTSTGGTRVESCPVVSGPPQTCTPTDEIVNGGGTGGGFTNIATDGQTIAGYNYFGVQAVPVASGTAVTAGAQVYSNGGDDQVGGVALGSTAGIRYLYWSVEETAGTAGTDSHKIFRCQLGGGTYPCSTTTTPLGPELVYDGGSTNRNPGPLLFDTTAQVLYWLDQGTTPTPPYATDGKLLACNVGGGCAPKTLALNLHNPVNLTQDANTIFFATQGDAQISACAKGGCNSVPTVLATGENQVYFLAADGLTAGGSVFWAGYNTIRRIAKP